MTDCDAHAATVRAWEETARAFCQERDASRRWARAWKRSARQWRGRAGQLADSLAASRKEAAEWEARYRGVFDLESQYIAEIKRLRKANGTDAEMAECCRDLGARLDALRPTLPTEAGDLWRDFADELAGLHADVDGALLAAWEARDASRKEAEGLREALRRLLEYPLDRVVRNADLAAASRALGDADG